MALVTVTFVRHGESTDNLKTIWAGWKDAPLSNHGMNQAEAAGEYFASTNTSFTVIHASPLKRAHSTAQAIYRAQPDPKPPFHTSLDVREQHFGAAEGHKWILHSDRPYEEHYAKGEYPVIYDRSKGFPEGESLNDLQARAERAMNDIVVPAVWEAARTGTKAHLAIVSHGLCISELIAALVRKDKDANSFEKNAEGGSWTGLLNTAWTRVTIDVHGLGEGQTLEVNPEDPPPLKVAVTYVNQHSHLDKVKRQKGGIGSAAHDPAQKDIRAFFGGAKVEVEEGRATSNVFDETLGDD